MAVNPSKSSPLSRAFVSLTSSVSNCVKKKLAKIFERDSDSSSAYYTDFIRASHTPTHARK